MRTIGIMATYPPRSTQLFSAVASVADQLDELHLVLNEYEHPPLWSRQHSKIIPIIPSINTYDVGKFCIEIEDECLVFLLDDDLIYPEDYVLRLRSALLALAHIDPVVGVHGVIYPEYWDGKVSSRLVFSFNKALRSTVFVNQLGSGTVAMHARNLPKLSEMATAARFVDVRLANICYRRGTPMVCISREDDWLVQQRVESTIFEAFTSGVDRRVVAEVLNFGGAARLPVQVAALRELDAEWARWKSAQVQLQQADSRGEESEVGSPRSPLPSLHVRPL